MKKVIFTLAVILATGLVTLNAQVTNGLVAKYSFNSGTANDEVGSNNGTVNGATLTTDRFGNANKAYYFDGINDKIDFGSSTVFEFGQNNFSISLWTKFSNSQHAPLLNKRNDSPTFDQYSIFVGSYGTPDSSINFYFKPSPGGVTGAFRTVSSPFLDSGWHNITVIHSFLDSTSLFVDGIFIGKSSISFTTEDFNIVGANLVAGFTNILGSDYYFKGSIDDIRIYNRVLTPLEVDSLFDEPNPMTTGVQDFSVINNSIGIYPNPTTSQIYFSVQTNVQLTNLAGQVISDKKNVNTLDISDQLSGIYFLTLYDNIGQVIQRSKIVKE
ncbi:MAG: LamG-like jellyroll fold domain-containing protein [Bacteroidia bacterium]